MIGDATPERYFFVNEEDLLLRKADLRATGAAFHRAASSAESATAAVAATNARDAGKTGRAGQKLARRQGGGVSQGRGGNKGATRLPRACCASMHRVGYPAPLFRPALPACCRAWTQSRLGKRCLCQRGMPFVSGARVKRPPSRMLTNLDCRVVVEPDLVFVLACFDRGSLAMFGCASPRSCCLVKEKMVARHSSE